MKIAQFYDENNHIRLGIVEDGSLVPIDFHGDMIDYISRGSDCKTSADPISLDETRFAPVVSRPSKIIAIGLNYVDHIEESKGELPKTPLLFSKFPNSLTGHNEKIVWDTQITNKVDFEAELVVIMGKTVYQCPESEVMGTIFGYTCGNDVSARDLQFGDGQWVRGKSLDTFCPLGPWIVTPDEIPDPHTLDVKSRLNGDIMQDSNTSLMVFKLPELISFISRNFTLVSGDVILTGTPSGVGAFRKPSIYLKDGDEIIVEIEKIGELVNTCQSVS